MLVLKQLISSARYYFYNHFISNTPSYFLRHQYIQKVLKIKLENGCSVHMGCFITGNQISIGHHTVVNRHCYLDGRIGLEIGSNVSISPEVYILSLSHDPQSKNFDTVPGKVRIGNRSWIGVRAIIQPGLTLGEGCVVAAGSVVTRDVPPFTIVGGIPARVIGERSQDLDYTLHYFPYFDTDIT